MNLGFIGLGAMGSAIAKNLAAAGHQIKAWNRSGVELDGITRVATVEDVFDADVVFTMLSDDAAIRAVLLDKGTLTKAKPGTIHIVCSTISVAFSQELMTVHAEAGLRYIAAPVLGRPDVAARAELNVLVAGAREATEAVAPLFEAIGRHTWNLGEEPPRANIAKIACNMMITMAIEAMAESTVLVEGSGLPRDQFFELILGTLFGSRPYQSYSANISAERYEPGFKAVLGLKDLRLAREASAAIGKSLPMLDAVHGRMAQAVEAGMGSKDWSAMAGYTINHA
jgi:3-hydroxyisobutyrate dehydrogenase-like beta-hydroxyacid dehydrogenase